MLLLICGLYGPLLWSRVVTTAEMRDVSLWIPGSWLQGVLADVRHAQPSPEPAVSVQQILVAEEGAPQIDGEAKVHVLGHHTAPLSHEPQTPTSQPPEPAPCVQQILVFEEGEPQIDGEAGDLKFVVITQPHGRFERQGDDLRYNATISLVEALVGFSKQVSSTPPTPTCNICTILTFRNTRNVQGRTKLEDALELQTDADMVPAAGSMGGTGIRRQGTLASG